MNTQKAIEQLGYKPSEAQVYIVLLQIGETTASYIASRVKLPRTSVQVLLERLHKDGLVNFYVKKRYKYWVAENPQRLMTIIKEKEATVERILPSLMVMRRAIGDRPAAHVFIGIEEIKQIYEDILEVKHHCYALIPWDSWIALCGEDCIDEFEEKRKKNFLHLRLLTPKTALAALLRTRDAVELRETKFLPNRIAINTAMLIYDNRVAIITLNKCQPTGILICDTDISTTMKELFEEVWGTST